MNKGKNILTLIFAALMVTGAFVISGPAQTRRIIVRPVVVRRNVSPYRGYRNYWGSPAWRYSNVYDPYWNDPYLRYQEQRYYLQRELQGNERELQKHEQKYRADGYISPKEQKELADDIRDVQRSRQKLRQYGRGY